MINIERMLFFVVLSAYKSALIFCHGWDRTSSFSIGRFLEWFGWVYSPLPNKCHKESMRMVFVRLHPILQRLTSVSLSIRITLKINKTTCCKTWCTEVNLRSQINLWTIKSRQKNNPEGGHIGLAFNKTNPSIASQ